MNSNTQIITALQENSPPCALAITPIGSSIPKKRWLSSKEEEIFARYSLQKRCSEWIAGRVSAKQALAEWVKEDSWQKLEIFNREDGRPYSPQLAQEEDISISHSKGLACAVVASSQVGIDIQYMQKNLLKIASRFCSAKEKKIIQSFHDSSLCQLALLWSCKEALQKALSGKESMPGFLQLELQEVQKANGIFRCRFSDSKREERDLTCHTCQSNEYALALAFIS